MPTVFAQEPLPPRRPRKQKNSSNWWKYGAVAVVGFFLVWFVFLSGPHTFGVEFPIGLDQGQTAHIGVSIGQPSQDQTVVVQTTVVSATPMPTSLPPTSTPWPTATVMPTLPPPTSIPPSSPTQKPVYPVFSGFSASSINVRVEVRDQPDYSAPVIYTIPIDTLVSIVGKYNDPGGFEIWYYVYYSDYAMGWVSYRWMNVYDPYGNSAFVNDVPPWNP